MDDKRRVRISRFISKHLRHSPEELGLVLDPGGWGLVDDLLLKAKGAGVPITRVELDEVVARCDKQRFAFNDSGTRIRASQGHSTEVDLQLTSSEPPDQLFHGTAERNLESIVRDGIHKMARHHVHLSPDRATAVKVGQRHGKPAVIVVDAGRMNKDGHPFFVSANGVWLVESVPPQYLRLETGDPN